MQQYLDIAYQFANLCKYILHSLQNDVDDFELNVIKMYIVFTNSYYYNFICFIFHVLYIDEVKFIYA